MYTIVMGVSSLSLCCPTGGTQLVTLEISDVLVRVGEEATEAGCCRDVGTYGEGLLGVWDTDYGSSFAQLLDTNVVVL